MKTTWFKSALVLTTLALFAVGCGKDGGGSSGGSAGNIPGSNNLTSSGSAASTAATNWYNGTAEGSTVMGTVVQVQRIKFSTTSSSSGQNCEEKKFLGIPYYYCTSSSNNSSGSNQEVVSTANVNTRTNNTVRINTKSNSELAKVFNGSAGTLVNASQSGNEFKLAFLNEGSSIVTTYTINKAYHSQINPVRIEVQNLSTGAITVTNTYTQILYQ